ncbi:MAG TPA: redoxin domain-containing protein [Planctomycetota bacterium]|nr:redoxin domain-containing protein [Planctomycetota bacterium]
MRAKRCAARRFLPGLALLLASAPGRSQGARAPATRPARAPDAVFVDPDGEKVRLSDYRGKKPVVLLFTRGLAGGFACAYCGTQARDYKARYGKLRGAGAEVLLVLPGDADVDLYLNKVGTGDPDHPEPGFTVPYPVVLDPDLEACKAFDVPARRTESGGFPVDRPATFVIGKDGSILYAYHGEDPSDRPTAESVLGILEGRSVESRPTSRPLPAPASAPASLPWVAYAEGLETARRANKPVLLEFYADW